MRYATLPLAVFLLFTGCQETPVTNIQRGNAAFEKKVETAMHHEEPTFELITQDYFAPKKSLHHVKGMVRKTLSKREALSLFRRFVHHIQQISEDESLQENGLFKNPIIPANNTFILAFWTEDIERPSPEYAAEIRMKGGIVTYYHKEAGSEFLDGNDTTVMAFDALD